MGIDFSRIANSALQAALDDGQQPEAKQHHRRLTAGKAIVAGAAVAVAAKYAVDKTSPLKRKAAMAAVRHTVRNRFGDVIPESLHDKLMDSGFFDHDDEDFDAPQGETKDFFDEADGAVGEESEDQEFFEEPEDEEGDEPEDEAPEEPEDVELDEPEDNEEPQAEDQEEEPEAEDQEEEPEAEDQAEEPEAEEEQEEHEAEDQEEEPEAEEEQEEPEAEEDEEEKKPRRSRRRTRAGKK